MTQLGHLQSKHCDRVTCSQIHLLDDNRTVLKFSRLARREYESIEVVREELHAPNSIIMSILRQFFYVTFGVQWQINDMSIWLILVKKRPPGWTRTSVTRKSSWISENVCHWSHSQSRLIMSENFKIMSPEKTLCHSWIDRFRVDERFIFSTAHLGSYELHINEFQRAEHRYPPSLLCTHSFTSPPKRKCNRQSFMP